MERHEADLVALTQDPKVRDAFTQLNVAHGEPAQLLTPDPVIEERCEDRPITLALERVLGRRREQCPGLVIGQRRRHAFARGRARRDGDAGSAEETLAFVSELTPEHLSVDACKARSIGNLSGGSNFNWPKYEGHSKNTWTFVITNFKYLTSYCNQIW